MTLDDLELENNQSINQSINHLFAHNTSSNEAVWQPILQV